MDYFKLEEIMSKYVLCDVMEEKNMNIHAIIHAKSTKLCRYLKGGGELDFRGNLCCVLISTAT